ncbi:MAG: hypothetical protein DSM106950_11100 [Stigonema ocellatum SAG 48.90 = DSM 106950]|nr:hypothetical protein [Stigonema ocellatum SAG 48.90 = DSM 106950]
MGSGEWGVGSGEWGEKCRIQSIGFLFDFGNTRRVGTAHHVWGLVGSAHPTLLKIFHK